MQIEPIKQRKETALYVALGGLSLIFLSGGYYLEHEYHRYLLSHLATEIGIAWIVALILAMTIEHVSRKRDERIFREEKETIKRMFEEENEAIRRDVFKHVLGYRLPEGTFAELDNQILRAEFIRRDFKCSYKLEVLTVGPENTKFMKVHGTLTYEIVNRTPERKPYLFSTIVERAPVEELNSLVKFVSVNVKGCEERLALETEDEIRKAVDHEIRPNHLVIEKQISISGNTYASAVVRFEAVRVFEGGVSFLLHKLQTVGFSLKVEAPQDVEVSASAFLPEPLGEGVEHYPSSNTYHWVLKNPILPYQGVYVSWKSKAGAHPKLSAPAQRPNASDIQNAGEAETLA